VSSDAGTARSHILTVVVEDYFQVGAFSHLIPNDYWSRFETHLRRNTETALALLEEYDSQATFFTSGWIADNYPDTLRRIVEAGHEVACQGYFHHHIGELLPEEFGKDVRRSRLAVEDAIGQAVHGFRIGRGWIRPCELWVLDALAEAGFSYDSSFRFTGGGATQETIHRYSTPSGVLCEVPPTRLPLFGRSTLLAGGNYLRQLPDWMMRSRIDRWVAAHTDPLVFYFHTWELDSAQPRIAAASLAQRLRHYRNLDTMPDKIRYYLESYEFAPIAGHLDLKQEVIEQHPRDAIAAAPPELAPAPERCGEALPLTLVIPCYNEEDTLLYLDKTLLNFEEITAARFDLRYVMVDDGSTDRTWPLLQKLFGDRNRVTLIRHDRNKGIAAALITGFGQVRSEYLGTLDADCTFAPEQLIEMMSLMTENVDVVVASPTHAQGAMHAVPAWRSLLSRGAAFIYRCILRNNLTSYTSCFRLYRRRVIQGMEVYDPGFCGVTEILGRLDLAGCRITEYPAVLETRLLGSSKIRIFRTILGHLKLAFRLAGLRWLGYPMPAPAASELQVSYAENDRK